MRKTTSTLRRILIVSVLLVVFAIAFDSLHTLNFMKRLPRQDLQIEGWGISIVWVIVGVALIRSLKKGIQQVHRTVQTAAESRVLLLVNRIFSAAGYLFVAIMTLHFLHINVGSILVGGAVTGVIVGIGAQSTLSNLFAGLILVTLRPFSVGQTIAVRSWMFSGIQYSGIVVDINWYHTVLMDGEQKRVIPNASIIISAVTLLSASSSRSFSIPLPYRIPVEAFQSRLQASVQPPVDVSIREFNESSYLVQVILPLSADANVICEVRRMFDDSH